MVASTSFRLVLWRVVPLETPAVVRWCARCGQSRAFRCSDRFRINANQRKLDVWLVYRCSSCEASWNLRLLRRVAPASIDPVVYSRLIANDRELAWQHAFGPAARAAGAGARGGLPIRVERPAPVSLPARIRFALPYPLTARLDRVLAGELGISRAQLARWSRLGALVAPPRALRRPILDGQELLVRGP